MALPVSSSFRFPDEDCSLFCARLEQALNDEFHFIKQIAVGDAERRQDTIDRYMSGIAALCGLVGQIFPMVGYVQNITDLISMLRDRNAQDKANDFIQLLDDESVVKNLVRFRILAREITYRFGSLLKNAIRVAGREADPLTSIARIIAIRIFWYALNNAIGLDSYEPLFMGIIEGYQGAFGPQLKNVLNKTSYAIEGSRSSFTVEGMLARAAFIQPLDAPDTTQSLFGFMINHHEPKRDADFGHVKFLNDKSTKNASAKNASAMVKTDARMLINEKIPKYGYIALPTSSGLVGKYGYGKYNPETNVKNFHVAEVKKFSARYVSWYHIETYLEAMRSACTATFRDWLRTKYPDQFQCTRLVPIFRNGEFHQKVMDRKRLSFHHGDFTGVDFSFCDFKDVKITRMSQSLLEHCKFTNCSATGDALDDCSLSFSVLEACSLTGLTGTFRSHFGVVLNCNFAGSHFLNFEADCLDDASKKSMKSVTCNVQGVTVNLEEQLREMEARHRKKEELLAAKFARELARVQQEAEEKANQRSEERQREADRGRNAIVAPIVRQSSSISDGNDTDNEDDDVDTNGRFKAFSNRTLPQSIRNISQADIQALHDLMAKKMLEALFFTVPVAFLRELERQKKSITWLSLERLFRHSTSGANGKDGTPGTNGSDGNFGGGTTSNGRNGTLGNAGGNGGNATENVVSLMVVPGQNVFLATPKHAEIPTMLPLYDSSVSVKLLALGGRGGKGGAGGNGGNGARGRDGADATRYQNGEDGADGGDGGSGANGCNGGNAGNSHDIVVYVKEEDMELLYVIDEANCGTAPGGEGGSYGIGGNGGPGGRGGASYTWTTTEYVGKDSDGNSKYTTISHTNPGGRGGTAGRSGQIGMKGDPGKAGTAGTFTMHVARPDGTVDPYPEKYKPKLIEYPEIRTDTGIIEPGQWLRIFDMKMSNRGKMPTPPKGIDLRIRDNMHFVTSKVSKAPLHDVIRIKEDCIVSKDTFLDFKTARLPIPSANTVVDIHTQVEVLGELTRVHRGFVNFQTFERAVRIQYPLELSVTRGAHCILQGDQVPLTIKIRNLSLKAVGGTASTARLCVLSVCIPGADFNELCPVFRTGADSETQVDYSLALGNVVKFNVGYIPACREISITGTIALQRTEKIATRLYEHIPVCFSLTLGDIDRPMHDSSAAVIQREMHYIQVAEVRQAITKDDILLVANASTTEVEVAHWKYVARSVGKQLVVWNVSVYHGFTYGYQGYNLLDRFKNGVVVFLNTPFNRDDDSHYMDDDTTFMPIQYLNPGEIFEAARRRGIRTYVVNAQQSERHAHIEILPQFAMPLMEISRTAGDEFSADDTMSNKFVNRKSIYSNYNVMEKSGRDEHLPVIYQHVTINKKQMFGTPSEAAMAAKREGLKTKLSELNPNQDFYFRENFEDPVKVGGTFFKKYQCGEVEVRRGLDTTYAMIACRNSPMFSNHTNNADVFVVLKLMPLMDKLNLWRVHGLELFANAILSDLIDEQNVFVNYIKTHGSAGKDKLAGALTAWNMFTSYDHSDLIGKFEAGTIALKTMIIKVRFFTSMYTGKAKSVLKEIVREGSVKMLERYIPGFTVEDFRNARRTFGEEQFSVTKSNRYNATNYGTVYKSFVDPYGVAPHGITMNHWAIPAEKVLTQVHAPNNPLTSQLINEEPWKFKTGADRVVSMNMFVGNVRYRKQKVDKYLPNKLGEVVLDDDKELQKPKLTVTGKEMMDGVEYDLDKELAAFASAPVEDGDSDEFYCPPGFVVPQAIPILDDSAVVSASAVSVKLAPEEYFSSKTDGETTPTAAEAVDAVRDLKLKEEEKESEKLGSVLEV